MSHVARVADFAFAIRQALNEINIHSWNNFQMRIGKCYVYHTERSGHLALIIVNIV